MKLNYIIMAIASVLVAGCAKNPLPLFDEPFVYLETSTGSDVAVVGADALRNGIVSHGAVKRSGINVDKTERRCRASCYCALSCSCRAVYRNIYCHNAASFSCRKAL